MRLFAASLAVLVALPASPLADEPEGFRLDLNRNELRAAARVLVVEDLAVGETGLAHTLVLCSDGGRLFLDGSVRLVDRPREGPVYRIRRQANGSVSVDIEDAETPDGGRDPRRIAAHLVLASYLPCDGGTFVRGQLFAVTEILGARRASELFGD